MLEPPISNSKIAIIIYMHHLSLDVEIRTILCLYDPGDYYTC